MMEFAVRAQYLLLAQMLGVVLLVMKFISARRRAAA